ncbi:MAG: hypothetical protein JSR91_03470 [Proteobacteria bacterium]|nr:hypothetical protein [Pseudomonadota bacterium]
MTNSDRMMVTMSVGVTVKRLQIRTNRMCRRDPAAPRWRSSQSCVNRTASTATSAVATTRSATRSPVIQPVVLKLAGAKPASQP